MAREKRILVDYLTDDSSRHSRPKQLNAKTYLQNTSRLRNTIDPPYLTVGELKIARKGQSIDRPVGEYTTGDTISWHSTKSYGHKLSTDLSFSQI